ncbi:MAG: NTP transferase domain-containing protein [Actinobacteria bacterium]|nr:NTP transferase domain-containing protein [Actinomycetota bacterium]
MTPDDITLLVMAGGLGSRFGGDKQLVDVGPDGEAFLDFAIRDALAAGIGHIVVVARTDLDVLLREHLERQHGPDLPLTIVHQDTYGPERRKPWGTGHAVLSAADACSGAVVVLNADDHYGPSGVRRTVEALLATDGRNAVILAFELGHTLSSAGSVSRGICRVVDGRLVDLVETHGIRRHDGRIIADDPSGQLSDDVPVSMNLWGLPAAAMARLAGQWAAFHVVHSDDPSAEFLLPEALDQQRSEGLLHIDVVGTDEPWIGVTSRDDLEVARAALAGA